MIIGGGQPQPNAKDRSPCFAVSDRDRSAVGIDDPAHDGKAKPGAAGTAAIPPPKPAENQLALRDRKAGPFIADLHAAAAVYIDFDVVPGGV